jgi:hypothetical protein
VKRPWAIVTAIVLTAGVARADTLPPRAFTERVARAVLGAMPSAKVALSGDLQFVVRYASGASATSDLGKAYQSYQHDPEHLDDLVQAQVAALVEATGDETGLPKLDRTRIVPIIKDRSWFEAMARRGREQSPPQELVAEPLNGDLVVVYAENRLGTLRILSNRDEVGDRARLRELALTNLSRMLPKIEIRPGADGVLLISSGGEFDASLLLADNLWVQREGQGRRRYRGRGASKERVDCHRLEQCGRPRALARRGEQIRRRTERPDGRIVCLSRRQVRPLRCQLMVAQSARRRMVPAPLSNAESIRLPVRSRREIAGRRLTRSAPPGSESTTPGVAQNPRQSASASWRDAA